MELAQGHQRRLKEFHLRQQPLFLCQIDVAEFAPHKGGVVMRSHDLVLQRRCDGVPQVAANSDGERRDPRDECAPQDDWALRARTSTRKILVSIVLTPTTMASSYGGGFYLKRFAFCELCDGFSIGDFDLEFLKCFFREAVMWERP